MSHSDEVSGAVVGISSQVAQKGVETAQHLVDKTVDNIAKLMQALFNKDGYKPSKNKEVTSSDMTDIKSGEVGIKELVADAKKNGDTVVSTDGYSNSDMKYIAVKAKEYGIPVAFTGKKGSDNVCAHVRDCDKAMFERICTELMQSKIKTKPDVLDNFKAERWEIDGIQRELSRHDLNANWGQTKDGEYFCLFEKADKKAVLMARNEFLRKCDEVENGLTIDKGEDSFYTLTDKSGGVITFDTVPARSELSAMLQDKFGYDENKAEIACGKFGETLDGELRAKFFGSNPHNEFIKIENGVKVEGENILVKDYTCLRITPKADGVPCLVYRDSDNNFAVLNPEKMTRKQMAEVIRDSLEIEDEKTVNALADKAAKVNDYYAKQNSDNFVLAKSETIGDVQDDKSVELQSNIERLDKDKFQVVTSAYTREFTGLNVGESAATRGDETASTNTLVLSFSDKKTALSELQKMFAAQGLSAETAKQSAKEVFAKAQTQSAEKVLQIEQIKVNAQSAEVHGTAANTAEPVTTVRYGSQTDEFDMTDREKALSELMEKFGVCEEEAELLLDMNDEIVSDTVGEPERPKTNDKPVNGHERTPTPKVEADVKPAVDGGDNAPELPKAPAPRKR